MKLEHEFMDKDVFSGDLWGQFNLKRAEMGKLQLTKFMSTLSPQLRVKLLNDYDYFFEMSGLFLGFKPIWFDSDISPKGFSHRDREELRTNVGKYFKRVGFEYFANIGLCLRVVSQLEGKFKLVTDEESLIVLLRTIDFDLRRSKGPRNDIAHHDFGILLGYPIEDVEIFNSKEEGLYCRAKTEKSPARFGWTFGCYSEERYCKLLEETRNLLVDSGAYTYFVDNLAVRMI